MYEWISLKIIWSILIVYRQIKKYNSATLFLWTVLNDLKTWPFIPYISVCEEEKQVEIRDGVCKNIMQIFLGKSSLIHFLIDSKNKVDFLLLFIVVKEIYLLCNWSKLILICLFYTVVNFLDNDLYSEYFV